MFEWLDNFLFRFSLKSSNLCTPGSPYKTHTVSPSLKILFVSYHLTQICPLTRNSPPIQNCAEKLEIKGILSHDEPSRLSGCEFPGWGHVCLLFYIMVPDGTWSTTNNRNAFEALCGNFSFYPQNFLLSVSRHRRTFSCIDERRASKAKWAN